MSDDLWKRELQRYCDAHPDLGFMNLAKANPMRNKQIEDDRSIIEYLSPALSGSIKVTDIDGAVERNGNLLLFEHKHHLPNGESSAWNAQCRMFKSIAVPGVPTTVFAFVALDGVLTTSALRVFCSGRDTGWVDCDYTGLCCRIHDWSLWADKNPSPQFTSHNGMGEL